MTISSSWSRWRLTTGLIALSLVPVAAGAHRLGQLGGGAPVTAENARFFDMPVPVVLHIICATTFCLAGAFQFAAAFRRRRPGWHRVSGRVTVVCGLVTALTGLWMTFAYDLPPADGTLLAVLRVVFGIGMAACLVLGLVAIRRRQFAQHRAWMARGYAIGLGAGTQVFTHLPWVMFLGPPGVFTRALLMGAGWMINLAVVEWFLRARAVRPGGRAPGRAATAHRADPIGHRG